MKVVPQQVTLIDHMGSDLSVVDAARVSFDKQSCWIDGDEPGNPPYLSQADEKLIGYLAKHNHWSPFSHAFVSFRVKCPLFVARQLGKHQVGLSWNEVSRRYVDSEPEFYVPTGIRPKAANVKQGSGDAADSLGYCADWIKEATQHSLDEYDDLLRAGVCPEQARMVLPQNTMTEFIWSGSLFAFARVCNLRLDSHTQRETQEVAQMIYGHLQALFPVSTAALVSNV